MQLSQLRLRKFRNFRGLHIKDIHPHLNIVIKPNGFGKSNLLEGIYLLSTGSSPRTKRAHEMIQWGEKTALVEGMVAGNKLLVEINQQSKNFLLNGKKVSLRRFLSLLQAVYFQAADLNLLIGSPINRRRFLNRLIAQLDFAYLQTFLSYRELLKQRNSLLKANRQSPPLFTVIEEQMSKNAVGIFLARSGIIKQLNKLLAQNGYSILYLPSPAFLREFREKDAENIAGILQEKLREKLEKLREKEKKLGFTLIGSQRDDFVMREKDDLILDGWKDLGIYGSRGEQRMAVIRLKLSECKIIEKTLTESPVLLLDDIFSELDQDNCSFLMQELPDRQIFITSTEETSFPAEFPNNSRIFLH